MESKSRILTGEAGAVKGRCAAQPDSIRRVVAAGDVRSLPIRSVRVRFQHEFSFNNFNGGIDY